MQECQEGYPGVCRFNRIRQGFVIVSFQKGKRCHNKGTGIPYIDRSCQDCGDKGKDRNPTQPLRKTFGYFAYNEGYYLSQIQKLLNHSTPGVTLRYIEITQDQLDEIYMQPDL
jgi:integrase